jgi:hypothetical protein
VKDDIELVYKGQTIPLHLGKDPDTGLRKFQASDAKIMSPMQTTDRPVEARIPYLKEVNLFQTTYHGGCGQKYQTDLTRYYDSEGADASVLNKVMQGPKIVKNAMAEGHTLTAAGVKGINFLGDFYVAWGHYLWKWTASGFDDPLDCGDDITDICVWGDYLIIARGLAAVYKYWDGSTLTESNLSKPIQFCQTIVDVLWASVSAYEVASSTNPLNGGSWETATTVGNTSVTITGILEHPDSVYVGTEEMPYYIDDDGTVDPMDHVFHCYKSAYTGRNMFCHNGFIYIPAGNGGLYEYDTADSITNRLSPDIYCGNIGAHLGNILAMAGDDQYLYAIIDNGTTIDIMRGRWEMIKDSATWVWHPIGSITGLTDSSGNCNHAYISNLAGSLRLWIICNNAADGIYYMHIPTIYSSPDLDTDFLFNGNSTFYTSWIRGDNPDTNKRFYRLGIRNTDTTATYPIAVYYRTVEDGAWTLLTTLTSDGYTQVNFPDNTYGYMIQFKILMESTSYTSSPVLESLSLYFAEYASLQETEQRYTINERYEFRVWGGSDTFWEHADYADTKKAYFSISLHTFGVDIDHKVTIKYRLSHEAFWRTLDQRCDTSPWQTISFPVDTVSNIIYLDFEIEDSAASQLLTYVINGKLMPDKQKQFTFSAHLSDMHPSTTGALIQENVKRKLALLREIDNSKWPVLLKTFAGHECYVTIDSIHELTMATGPHKSFEYWATINCTEQKGV